MGFIDTYKGTEVEFQRGIWDMAKRLGLDPKPIVGVMYLESGLRPDAVNRYSRATGLIQFMPSTAQRLGTTVEALVRMTRAQQLPYVEQYFRNVLNAGKRFNSVGDYYMAVFNPSHVGKSPDYVLYTEGEKGYDQNKGLDKDKNGRIEVKDVTRSIEGIVAGSDPLPLPPEPGLPPTEPAPGGVPLAPTPVASTKPPGSGCS
jgi:hypothetical protein